MCVWPPFGARGRAAYELIERPSALNDPRFNKIARLRPVNTGRILTGFARVAGIKHDRFHVVSVPITPFKNENAIVLPL